jgi:hypothetical protein
MRIDVNDPDRHGDNAEASDDKYGRNPNGSWAR